MSYYQPYDEELLPSFEGRPVFFLNTQWLIPTQPLIWLPQLVITDPDDPRPLHVVVVDELFYIHDGHHRWLRRLFSGKPHTSVQVVNREELARVG